MQNYLLKIITLSLVLFSTMISAKAPTVPTAAKNMTGPSSTIQITLEKDFQGTPVAQLINAKGIKSAVTLETLLQAVAESWEGGPIASPTISSNTIAVIKIYKEDGKLIPYIQDKDGHNKTLDLGGLLGGTAANYPGCTAQQIDEKSLIINIVYNVDSSGDLRAYYVGTKGHEPLTLGALIRDTTILLNHCDNKDVIN